jgi:hypothetical protein
MEHPDHPGLLKDPTSKQNIHHYEIPFGDHQRHMGFMKGQK